MVAIRLLTLISFDCLASQEDKTITFYILYCDLNDSQVKKRIEFIIG